MKWFRTRRSAGSADSNAPDPTPSSDPNAASCSGDVATDIATEFRNQWIRQHEVTAQDGALLPVALARAVAAVLPVDGAGLSLLNDDFRVPLGASHPLASDAERLQFTVGQGPCLDTARQRRTIVASLPDMEREWPIFAEQLLAHTPYRAIISLPMELNTELSGAIDLFMTDEAQLHKVDLADAMVVARQATDALVIAQAIAAPTSPLTDEPELSWLRGPSAHRRTYVWAAMGMLMTRYHLTAPDALALLRSYAIGHDAVLDDVALDVVERRLDVDQVSL